MIVFTETMAGLVGELAKFGGNVTAEISEDRIVVSVTPGGVRKCAREIKSAGRSALAGWKPGKRVSDLDPGKLKRLPKVRAKKPCPKKEFEVRDGTRVRVFTWNGESHTAAEWGKKYNCSSRAIYQRFAYSGTPETTSRRGRGDRSSLKAKLAKGGCVL